MLSALGNSLGKSVIVLSALGNFLGKSVARVSALGNFLEKVHESEFCLFLRVRSHMATRQSNMATVAMLLQEHKCMFIKSLQVARGVTWPHGHGTTL